MAIGLTPELLDELPGKIGAVVASGACSVALRGAEATVACGDWTVAVALVWDCAGSLPEHAAINAVRIARAANIRYRFKTCPSF